MKYLSSIILLILITIPGIVNAEYIFKKDGLIIKGSITKEDPSLLTVKTSKGAFENIRRSDIIRVLYTELFMGKVYIRLTSGEIVEGYQVDEDRDNYVFRKDINKPEEFIMPRKKVMFIARTNPTDLTSDASIERILLKWSPPFKPAKLYKIYIRETKKGGDFKNIGETDNLSYNLKNLNKSASYEVYVTAISDDDEESLPSDKIITNTIPYPPEDLLMTEKYSDDGKNVTLSMTWKPVTDPESRVKSYIIYKLDDNERKKIGTTKENAFTVKEFPAEGKHRFALVSVNDLGTESVEVISVFDAGYKIYTRVSGAYLLPMGKLNKITDPGYGGILDITAGGKFFSAGIETGYLDFKGAERDIKKMAIVPLLAVIDYRIPLFLSFSIRPVIKAGTGYIMTEYALHNTANPLTTDNYETGKFNPIASGGGFIEYCFGDNFNIFGGAEYSAIFQDSGTMSYISCSFGASVIF